MPSHSQRNEKNADIDLGWDDTFEDAYLNDIMKHRIGTLDKNLFNFIDLLSMLVEPRQSTLSTNDHEIV